jgi:hypothetical protein
MAAPTPTAPQVLAGARLPESDEEWTALHAALTAVRQHLRPDTSVERLYAELRDFVGMVVDWWGNRKKAGEAGEAAGGGGRMPGDWAGGHRVDGVGGGGTRGSPGAGRRARCELVRETPGRRGIES